MGRGMCYIYIRYLYIYISKILHCAETAPHWTSQSGASVPAFAVIGHRHQQSWRLTREWSHEPWFSHFHGCNRHTQLHLHRDWKLQIRRGIRTHAITTTHSIENYNKIQNIAPSSHHRCRLRQPGRGTLENVTSGPLSVVCTICCGKYLNKR